MGGRPRTPVVLDVSELPADAVAVDLLARLQLALRRSGRELVLARCPAELRELIELAGLDDVLRDAAQGDLTRGSIQAWPSSPT